MAKVIRSFKERYHNFKLYSVGDEYPDDNQERIQYLISQGFLEKSEQTKTKAPTLEEFSALSAVEQKKMLSDMGIEGDDSNAEKRVILYKQYLGVVSETPSGSDGGGDVNDDGSDAG